MPCCNTATHKRLQRVLRRQCIYAAHDTRPLQTAIIPSAPRWSVSQHCSTSSAYQNTRRNAGRYTAQHSRPIIIRYIRVQGHAPVIPCQTAQHTADHASPAGSRCFPRPAACNLAPGQRSGRTGSVWHPPPGGAVQRQERGGRRGTIGGYRRSSFRAFARSLIKVSNSRSVPAGIVAAASEIVVANSRSFSNKIVVK